MSLTISMDETDLVIEIRLPVIGELTQANAKDVLDFVIDLVLPELKGD